MSPARPTIPAQSNVYTALLALAFLATLATAGFVAYMCYSQFGTILNM